MVIVIAPAYNEEGKIGKVVTSTLAVPQVDKFVVVDDFSRDRTSEEAAAAGAIVVRHPHNRGAGAAIRSGIMKARELGATVIAVIAGDGQHISEELPRVIDPVLHHGFDLAQGSRFATGGQVVGANEFRVPLIRFYSIVFSGFTGTRLTDATNGLRAFRADILERFGLDLEQSWLDRYELEPYLLYRLATSEARVIEVPCTVIYPPERYTHMRPLVDWWKIFRPLVFLRTGIKR